MADGGEPGHRGLAGVAPGGEVGELQAQQRSAQFELVLEEPPVRGGRIGVRPALQADLVVKVPDLIFWGHLEHRGI